MFDLEDLFVSAQRIRQQEVKQEARTDGQAGVQALLQRIGRWRVPVRWYVFAIGYLAAIKLAVALIHRIATGTWPRFGDTPWYVMIGAITVSMWVQAGEEIGWRGYALPRLADRMGLEPAAGHADACSGDRGFAVAGGCVLPVPDAEQEGKCGPTGNAASLILPQHFLMQESKTSPGKAG